MREFRRRRSDAADVASPGQQADREPIHVLAPLREIRLDDSRDGSPRAGPQSDQPGASSRPAESAHHFWMIFDSRSHVASNDATTAGRSIRCRDTRNCPRNVLAAC